MGISNTIPPSRLIQPGVVANTAARPTSPFEGQAIYQVDTNQYLIWNGTAWTPPTNLPWGVMGTVYRNTGDFTGTTTLGDITGMSITFTAVAGRIYRASWGAGARKETAAGWSQITFADSANALYGYSIQYAIANQYLNLSGVSVITGLTAGSKTFKLRGVTENNTVSIFGNTNAPLQFIIEDIGPA